MPIEGWIRRITINGDHVEENGQEVSPGKAIDIKKTWQQQQAIDLSIHGEVKDEDVLKFLQKGV